jgi:succinate dehydrogenase / fumarate reductase, cytochrome b subunit
MVTGRGRGAASTSNSVRPRPGAPKRHPPLSTHPNMRERPLSPHLSVYKMSQYTLATSIFNRLTGVSLSVGLIVLVYWLMAVASGTAAYARAYDILSSGILKLVYAGLLVAFCYHLVAGIRHLVWDTGRGLERVQSKRSAAVVIAVSIALILVLGYWLFLAGGRAQ